MNGHSDQYFELLEIIKTKDQLEKLGDRLALAALRIAKQIHEDERYTVSPSDRPFETFTATKRPVNKKKK